MKIVSLFLFVVLMSTLACNISNPPKHASTTTSDTVPYYPISEFFATQIQFVDLRNFYIYKTFMKDGEKDSSGLSKQAFITLVHTYYDTGITTSFRTQYKETVFHDLSTKSYTLHYSPMDPNAKVQSIDVLLDEDTQMAKRILIRSVFDKGDTSITENINWNAYKSFQVSRSLKTNKGYHSTELMFVKWNDKP